MLVSVGESESERVCSDCECECEQRVMGSPERSDLVFILLDPSKTRWRPAFALCAASFRICGQAACFQDLARGDFDGPGEFMSDCVGFAAVHLVNLLVLVL